MEIYGSISGLKMNKEKTKVIWIGRKRFSRDKLDVSVNLEWGASNFKLLGIDFFTDITLTKQYNYIKVLEKIKKIIAIWKNRYFTPLGRITIIKTNLVSQCVHLLSTLPKSNSFLKELNSILYNFLWNGKPDKIRRSASNLKYIEGGLNMINIYNFDRALRLNWEKITSNATTVTVV